MNARSHPLRVAEVIVETEDTRSLVFEVPDDVAEEFRYRPGQFVTVHVPRAGAGTVARCYSLSSSPYTAEPLTVTVKRTPNGPSSDWLVRGVREGSVLRVQPPAGGFTPPSLDGDFLFLAAGSGIAPVMSIVKSVLAAGTGRAVLVYANRDERSVIFAEQLDALAAAYPDRFAVVHWLESLQGLPDPPRLRALAEPFRDREVYACGPGLFVGGALEALDGLGVPAARIHLEQFRPLSGGLFPAGTENRSPVDAIP